jgi:hypothetical protein
MPSDHMPFPPHIQRLALARQKFRCASCKTPIIAIGETGQAHHKFGERAEGHHLIPNKMGGPITTDNCVVLCSSCHRSAHQGARWRDISIYENISKLPMPQKIAKIAALYPHYKG